MRLFSIFLILLLAAVQLVACTTSLPAPNLDIPTHGETGTSTPARDSRVDSAGGVQSLEGPEIGYKGIHFFLNPAMGSRLYVFDDVITLDGLTAHSIRFDLASEKDCTTWCLVVYPVSEFEKAFGFFAFPPMGYRGGAAVIFKAQEKALSFQQGSGKRALEAFGQNHYAVSNESLKYVYRGYSADRQYAVFVQIPTHAAGLLDTPPTMTPGPALVNDIMEYNGRAAESLNALSSADFTPNLDLLDALVVSIRVQSR